MQLCKGVEGGQACAVLQAAGMWLDRSARLLMPWAMAEPLLCAATDAEHDGATVRMSSFEALCCIECVASQQPKTICRM